MKSLTLIFLSLVFAVFATAQGLPPVPPGGTAYAIGLEGPRGLTFGPDGLLYVAEAGHGGTDPAPPGCTPVVPPVGPYHGGPTARISRVESNGSRSTVIDGLPSAITSLPSGDTLGVAAVAFVDGQLYALLAGGGCSHGNATPSAVVRINRKQGTAEIVANLSRFYREHPVAHPEPDDFEPDGTAYSMRQFHGDLMVVEPNHGRLLRINLSGKHESRIEHLTDFSAPLGHQVPTSLVSRDGRFYVGNLFHFPIVVGTSKLYQVTRHGFVVDYWGGLTTIVGVEVDDEGRLYVLELSSADGFPDIGKGRILRIAGQVVEEIVTGLSVPTAMTFDSQGNIYVSDLGAAPPGAGRILRFGNPISGRVITTVEVRPPAPLRDRESEDQHDER